MVIDARIKNKLLNWNDKEAVYPQFEKKCITLSKISGMNIDPIIYKVQYDMQASAMNTYVDLQTKAFKKLYKKYNGTIDFGMSGRLKSEFSHFEKVIRKFIDLIEKDEFKSVEILDDYAMKLFVFSVNYNVDKVSFDSNGVYVDSGVDEFRLDNNDIFTIPYDGRDIDAKVNIKNNEKTGEAVSNVFIKDATAYIKTSYDNQELVLPLNTATVYKKSNKDDLLAYCQKIQKDIEDFYSSNKFTIRKRKDYIANPKKSGYQSIHSKFYSEDYLEDTPLGMECQIRTYDMELFNNKERAEAYKPDEHKISANYLSKLPKYVVTTNFKKGGIQSYELSPAECFRYIYGISLKDYITILEKESQDVAPHSEDTSR